MKLLRSRHSLPTIESEATLLLNRDSKGIPDNPFNP